MDSAHMDLVAEPCQPQPTHQGFGNKDLMKSSSTGTVDMYLPELTMSKLLRLCKRQAEASAKQLAVVSSWCDKLVVDRLGRTPLSYIGHWRTLGGTGPTAPPYFQRGRMGLACMGRAGLRASVGRGWSGVCEWGLAGRLRA